MKNGNWLASNKTNSGWFTGRESRRQFLPKAVFVICSIFLILKCADWIFRNAPSAIANCIAFFAVSAALVLSVAIFPMTVRRLHDLGLSGWWVALFVIAHNVMINIRIPVVMYVWGFVQLGICAYISFWPGDKEANSYGLPVKSIDFLWIKRMAIVLAVPAIAEIAAIAWLKCHPVPQPEPDPACVQVFASEEMERKVGTLKVEGLCASFEAFRNETKGNSLTLTNMTVLSRGDLGGGVTELWCQLDRNEKSARLFVLVYFPSELMDSLPRPFAHNDRIAAVTGTVVANLDKYLRALKEYNGGLNAHSRLDNAIWIDNPVFDVAFADDAPPMLSDRELTGDKIAHVASGLEEQSRQEKVERLLRPLMGRKIEFSSCRISTAELDDKYCPHVNIEVLDPETQKLAFGFTVPIRDRNTAKLFTGLDKGASIGHVCAIPCEKGDFHYCRGCMTKFIWMVIVSLSEEKGRNGEFVQR